jgi:CheY-like chemotaxis protein
VNDDPLAELAHDLKTPITVILGYAYLLATRDDEETRTTAAHQITAAAHRLTAAIDSLLGVEARPLEGSNVRAGAGRLARRPARVFVVDDDVFVRRLLRMTLPAEEYEIAEAADGDIALAMIEVQRPDLVLLDWRMPATPGETVLRELKARHSDLAVIVLTAEGEHRASARSLGADAFLTKPFSPMELLRTVEQLLEDRAPNLVA